jgi:putative spermidine/putrescine transport system permease protein
MKDGVTFGQFWLKFWTATTILFVLGPLAFVVLVSLTPLNYISLPTTGISLRWYAQLAQNGDLLSAGGNSLVLAVGSSIAALLLGSSAAVASARWRFMLLQPLRLFATAPLLVPMVMSGLALLAFSASTGWQNQALRNYVGHIAITLPYVFRTVSASLAGFDPNQELAARNLGATPLKAFVLITLPQLGPGVAAGALFAFIVSFDNVGLSIFLNGAQFQTLPVQLFTYASYSNDPMVAAASVAMIAVSVLAIAAVERFFGLQKLLRGG